MDLQEIKSIGVNQIKANQLEIRIGGYRTLISYDSVIVVIDPTGQVFLGDNWKYSPTTSKYRNQFLSETTKETQEKLDSGVYKML